MPEERIYELLSEILGEILGEDISPLSPNVTPGDIAGWDSFITVNLVVEIERRFDFKMQAGDFRRLTCIGDFVAVIRRASGAAGRSLPGGGSGRG